MTEIVRGQQITLTSQWLEYAGGPSADVAGLTITITPSGGGSPTVGPTGSGIVHAATGLYTYLWSVSSAAALGDYTVVWDATDADSDAVQASEVITVTSGLSESTIASSGSCAEVYWISKTVIVDWVLADPDTGAAIDGATVTGTVTLPNGTTSSMSITPGDPGTGLYRATYDPTQAGLHAYSLRATGAADSAEQGTFTVRASLTGAEAIDVDPTTDVGMIRLLIPDQSELYPLFTDAQLQALLDAEGSRKRAAAQALDIAASSEVMVSKVIRTRDGLSTDGAKVAAELRTRATSLRKQADEAGDEGGMDTYFDIVDFGYTPDELAEPTYYWWP